MSFLFTFKLPSLPFNNPFTTPAAAEDDPRASTSTSFDQNARLRVLDVHGTPRDNTLYARPVAEDEASVSNCRKRDRTALYDNNYASSSRNTYHGYPQYASGRMEGSPNRTRRDMRVEYDFDSAHALFPTTATRGRVNPNPALQAIAGLDGCVCCCLHYHIFLYFPLEASLSACPIPSRPPLLHRSIIPLQSHGAVHLTLCPTLLTFIYLPAITTIPHSILLGHSALTGPSSSTWWPPLEYPGIPQPSQSMHLARQLMEMELVKPTTTPSRQEAEENVERPGKRRKLGIAETILSTAVSVAIVSAAVGYTAYRLWRDGGSTSGAGAGAQNDDETEGVDNAKKDPEIDWKGWKDRAERRGVTSHTTSGLSPPPPPYYAMHEDTWLGDGGGEREKGADIYCHGGRLGASTSAGGRSRARYISHQGSASRPGSKRGPMAKVHRSLRTTGSPRSDGRRDEGVPGRRKSHATSSWLERDERLASPTSRKRDVWRGFEEDATSKKTGTRGHHRRDSSKDVAVERSDSEEEFEEGSSRLDEQMDWMSERLRGLIADGKRALGREIVVAEGVAGSPSLSDGDGVGHVDDGEGGWEDAEEEDNVAPTSHRPGRGVVAYPEGKRFSTRESPRKWSTRQ